MRLFKLKKSLASVAQLVGESSHGLKSRGFDSQSGHMLRLWVWSLVRVHTYRKTTNLCFSLTWCFSPSLSSPFLALKAMKKMSSGEDKNTSNFFYKIEKKDIPFTVKLKPFAPPCMTQCFYCPRQRLEQLQIRNNRRSLCTSESFTEFSNLFHTKVQKLKLYYL